MRKKQKYDINFSRNHQFTTRLSVNNVGLEVVSEAKLLGTVLTNNLSWNRNTEELVKKAFRRMQLLYRASGFTNSREDLKAIYLTYVRSVIEQSAAGIVVSLCKTEKIWKEFRKQQ